MGMAASYAGSQDQRLTTMLSSGVDALLPRGAAELNISPIMQATSIFSLGLLHVGSGRHRLVDTALAEIGRRHLPGLSVKTNHREVYAFSSAIALGLMMLGRGGLNREQDTRCVSVLRSYFVEVEQLDQDESSEQQDEGHDVNITAPGATLALGMMYLRTEREDIACQLSAPQNTFELDHVRPDMLIIRMLSYNMIMWKRIQPTQTWLDSQIPTFIQNAWRRKNREHLDEMVELAYFNILAGAGYALGLKFAGTMDQTAHIMLLKIFDVFSTQLRQNRE
jgi:anaphase-promoting complex subunit 1